MYWTPKELAYLSDTDFLTTKRRIQVKINDLLVHTEEVLKGYIQTKAPAFPEGVSYKAGKISKGENYQKLPYQILDYPRLFHREDVFSLRTMCWWGHFFSTTLHLQGNSWEKYRELIQQKQDQFKAKDFYLGVHQSPWEYYLGEKNFRRFDTLSRQETDQYLHTMSFFKVAAFLPLGEGDQLPDFTLNFFRFLCDILEL